MRLSKAVDLELLNLDLQALFPVHYLTTITHMQLCLMFPTGTLTQLRVELLKQEIPDRERGTMRRRQWHQGLVKVFNLSLLTPTAPDQLTMPSQKEKQRRKVAAH
jgi:hypothetical protein